MKKSIGLVVLFMAFTGCACSQKAKTEHYRTALKHTNEALTACREDNRRKSAFIQRQHKTLVAMKKQRRQLGGHR